MQFFSLTALFALDEPYRHKQNPVGRPLCNVPTVVYLQENRCNRVIDCSVGREWRYIFD